MSLDREAISAILLRLSCNDHGSPSLTSHRVILVRVADANDHPPSLRQFTLLHTAVIFLPFVDGKNESQLGKSALSASTGSVVSAPAEWALPETIRTSQRSIFLSSGNQETQVEQPHQPNARLPVQKNGDPAEQDTEGDVKQTVKVKKQDEMEANVISPFQSKQLLSRGGAGQLRLRMYVPEDLPVGRGFARLLATDEDIGINGQLEYFIISQDPG
ncbi:unnamed protein product [Protopolystoma xenopodis]|uniref:Cadherin domain-containing protein n=1 Tax=Protopolystoma xenopodis TaxID=117903 RepID=A0A448WQ80_9PLAT|nr:unnamed protein product [Protopolystoma xenopodis]